MLFKIGNNKLSAMIRNFLLYFFIILFSALSAVPIKFFSGTTLFPNIASILIFYFMIIDQENIQYFAIFIFGVLFDVFNNIPLGVTSLVWLVSAKFISFIRTHLYTPDVFVVTVRDFAIFDFLNALIQWMLFSLLYRTPYPISNSVIQFLLNIIFFGVIYRLLRKIDKWFD